MKAQALSIGVIALVAWSCSGDKEDAAPKKVASEAVAKTETAPVEPSDAAPEAPRADQPLPEEFRVAMRRGRALMKRGEYPAATRSFEKALDLVPGHARAYSELGWAAFHTADYQRALEATRSSIRSANDSNLKAASLYNLGRIHEELHNTDKAIEAYEQSLAIRPHKSVAMRLAALESGNGPATERSVKMLGPFDSLSAFCHQEARGSTMYQLGGELQPECDGRAVEALSSEGGALVSAQLFEIRLVQPIRESGFGGDGEGEPRELVALQLGLKTDKGWYVLLDALNPYELGDSLPFAIESTMSFGESKELALRYAIRGERRGKGIVEAGVISCQLDEEGRPRCRDDRESQP